MDLWGKIMNALRFDFEDESQETHLLALLDEELVNLNENLQSAKRHLADVLASLQQLSGQHQQALKDIHRHEEFIKQALVKQDELLAKEIAIKVVHLEKYAQQLSDDKAQVQLQVDSLRARVQGLERDITKLHQQTDTIRASESIQRAQQLIASRDDASSLRTAVDSLAQLQRAQTPSSTANPERNVSKWGNVDNELAKKLERAGIIPEGDKADKVVERLRDKSSQDDKKE